MDDPLHCEFTHVRNFLIRTHCLHLIKSTALVHYERFRTRQLLALKEASGGGGAGTGGASGGGSVAARG